MIVVDSTVWIDFFRGVDNRETRILRQLVGLGVILAGDLILAEVLRGFPNERHARDDRETLERFAFAPMVRHEVALQAAANYRRLRREGITVRMTIEMLIGTFCIEHGHTLLHNDRDFEPLVVHLGLRTI